MSNRSRPLLILGCIVVGATALARPVATTKATEVSGRGFTIAVPTGFELADASDERLKAMRDKGGVALAATWRAGPGDGMRPSIVVVPLGSAWSGGDLGKDTTCADVAGQALAATPAMKLLRHQVVHARFGPVCQWEIVATEAARGAVGIFVGKGTDGWVITCNSSPDDQRARKACRQVLDSWKFK
jgi:hypothetical protein